MAPELAAAIDAIVGRHGTDRGALTSVLLEIQDAFAYLPPASIERVAERMGVPVVQVYQVARFYNTFSLTPRGRHRVAVCAGTACFVDGSRALLTEIGRVLGVAPGETTSDGMFTVDTVSCPGNCPAGPVVTVDGRSYGRVTVDRIEPLIRQAAAAEGASHD